MKPARGPAKDAFVWLLLFVPASVAMAAATSRASAWTFATAIVAIVPLAEWIRRATDHVARRAGPAIGGLLNVSFGNATELILALFVLAAGKSEVVKAQLTGSIIGNGLLGLGLAIVAGSIGRDKQTFKRERAGQLSSLLTLAVIALLLPAFFDYAVKSSGRTVRLLVDERLSLAVSVVLIVVYIANLIYTLVTHKSVFEFHEDAGRGDDDDSAAAWPLWISLAVLAAGTAATALEAEMVAGALASTATTLGLSEFFLGVIVLAVVGNAAEYFSAAYFARQGRMGLAISITVGSTIQIALLMAPVLVIVSAFTAHPMNLVFSSPLELIAIAAIAFAVNAVAQDGETTWFEGVLLLAIYALLGVAFFFV
jgi:Ca2+:H+ antiporter